MNDAALVTSVLALFTSVGNMLFVVHVRRGRR